MGLKRWFVSIMITGMALLIHPSVLFANGGPAQIPPSGTGMVFSEDSKVKLERETVHYRFDPASFARNESEPHVSVTYTLKNLSSQTVATTLLFIVPAFSEEEGIEPLNKDKEFQVKMNGQPLSYQWKGKVQLDNWYSHWNATIIDPVDQRAFQLRAYFHHMGVEIPLRLKGEEQIQLDIQYKDSGGYIESGVVNPIYSNLYFLTPASFWQGEPEITLMLTLPSTDIAFHSNIPLKKVSDQTYSTTLQQLPDEEWMLSVASKDKLWFGTNVPLYHITLITLCVLVVSALLFWLRMKIVWLWWLPGLVYPLALFALYFSIDRFVGYPFDFVVIPFIYVGTLLFIVWMQHFFNTLFDSDKEHRLF
jgi:hypothetical protein